MPLVGYRLVHPERVDGDHGIGYDYVFGSNGVFIQAENNLLMARVAVSECDIRGLAPVEPCLNLKHGRIPQALFDLALSSMLVQKEIETYMAITWDDNGYHLFKTEQESEAGMVKYHLLDNTILDIHSHGAFCNFSSKDDTDEKGLRLYGVAVINAGTTPVILLRAGVYGYYQPITWTEVFDGALTGATEELPATEYTMKWEKKDELQSELRTPVSHWWRHIFG